jgi:hypothetical protein
MNRDDIQKLLGGYATGTLTAEEQEALFDAALNDQELFDALAREQTLRDLLRDPVSKAQLLAALDEPPIRWYTKLFGAWRPLAAGMAMAAVTTMAVVAVRQSRKAQPTIISQATIPPAPPFAAPRADDLTSTGRADAVPKSQPAEPERDAASKGAANKGSDTPADGQQALADESRRAKTNLPAAVEKSKEIGAMSAGPRQASGDQAASPGRTVAPVFAETPPTLKEEQAPLPPGAAPSIRTLASGFREGAPAGLGGGGGGRGGRSSTRSSDTDSNGVVGGISGGIVGGVPSATPPPPPPAPLQMAKAALAQPQAQSEPFAKQSQSLSQQPVSGQQGQQGLQGQQQQGALQPSQQAQLPSSQADQLRASKPQSPSSSQTVQITAGKVSAETAAGSSNGSVDVVGNPVSVAALSDKDARALYYGNASPASDALVISGSPALASNAALARKKVAEEPQTKNQPSSKAANSIAATVSPAGVRPAKPGVRYSLLRKTATGEFAAVDVKNALPGDTLELQVTPNHLGTLTVSARRGSSGWRDVMTRSVEAMRTYATPPLRATDQELRVTLSWPNTPLADNFKRDEKATNEVAQQSTTEPATYVVGDSSSAKLEFVITLNHK